MRSASFFGVELTAYYICICIFIEFGDCISHWTRCEDLTSSSLKRAFCDKAHSFGLNHEVKTTKELLGTAVCCGYVEFLGIPQFLNLFSQCHKNASLLCAILEKLITEILNTILGCPRIPDGQAVSFDEALCLICWSFGRSTVQTRGVTQTCRLQVGTILLCVR